MLDPTLLTGAIILAVGAYCLVGVGVVSGLARLILDQGGDRELPTIETSDWCLLALLAAIWPIVLAILGVLSLAAVIMGRLCRDC